MAGKTHYPLSPEQAKGRLRLASERLSLRAWMRRSPEEALLYSFLAGVALAECPGTCELIRGLLRRRMQRSS